MGDGENEIGGEGERERLRGGRERERLRCCLTKQI